MKTTSRQRAFFHLFLAIVGMILLGTSLPGLVFQAGLAVPGAETVPTVEPVGEVDAAPSDGVVIPWLLQGGLALGFLLLLVALASAVWKKNRSKRIVPLVTGLLIVFAVFYLLPQWLPDQAGWSPIAMPEAQPLKQGYVTAPIGDPPESLLHWVVALLLASAAGLVVWLLARAFRLPRKVDPLAREVEAAVRAIAGGQNWQDVIVRCYLQMETAVAEEQGMERRGAMTVREFETFLINRGIPGAPVSQLTRLFEMARYGDLALNQQDELVAVDCLSAIRVSLRENREAVG